MSNLPFSDSVFIIGSPRSGTSIMAWALAHHPEFWTSAESVFFLPLFGRGHLRRVYRDTLWKPGTTFLERHEVSFEELAEHLGWGIDRLLTRRAAGKRWVESTPGYTLMGADLAMLFPRSRFIHIMRDGRAVVASLLASGFAIPPAKDFEKACRTWIEYMRLGHKQKVDFPDRTLTVRHADMAANPHAFFDRVFDFLDAPLSQKPAEYVSKNAINSSYGNVSAGDIKKAKDPSTLPAQPWGAWTEEMHQTFARIAGATMTRFGFGDAAPSEAPRSARTGPAPSEQKASAETKHHERTAAGARVFPSARAVGIDRCRGGWLAISDRSGGPAGWVYATVGELVDGVGDKAVMAVDMPIGLTDQYPRRCEVEARKAIGPRRSSVFSTPLREVFALSDYLLASKRHKELTGRGISKQAYAIFPPVRQIDELLLAEPKLRERVFEVHPELCFWAANKRQMLQHGKKSKEGHHLRRRILSTALGHDYFDELRRQFAKKDVADDDILDALIALWTARRIAAGTAARLPARDERDAHGLLMAMWY